MSLEINSVVLGGNLVRDVELKNLPNGSQVGVFALAVNRTFMTNGQKNQEVSYIDIEVWGKPAENCAQYIGKGSPVVVTGRLKQDSWQNESGEKRNRLKVIAANVQFLPSRRNQNSSEGYSSTSTNEPTGWE